ncbi:MAG: prepilin-type N-terminal cleavage/methylation domain-containing protein [Planctomycetota bacterium]|nr:MAG: prepilin-type N-terminal cleavage/methylation domain-containing protein [Planctomycetota bacterium]
MTYSSRPDASFVRALRWGSNVMGPSFRNAARSHAARVSAGPAQHGLTLMEVLISLFVLAIGLLGIAALLPVGQLQVTRGETAAQKRVIGDAALETIAGTGWLDPSRWRDGASSWFDEVAAASGTRRILRVTGSATNSSFQGTAPVMSSTEGAILEFRSGHLQGVRRRLSSGAGGTYNLAAALPTAPAAGDTFVIYRNEPFAIDPGFVGRRGGDFTYLAGDPNLLGPAPPATPMPRVTLTTTPGGLAAGPGLSDYLTTWRDDLSFVPDDSEAADADRAAAGDDDATAQEEANRLGDPYQLFYSDPAAPGRLKRKSDGAFSWLATFVPRVLGPPTTGPTTDPQAAASEVDYTVSVAVFRNRLVVGQAGLDADSHLVTINFVGGGYGGGAARLIDTMTGSLTESVALESLRADSWILVWSTEPNTRAYHWYRVVSAARVEPVSGSFERFVTLEGPDWNPAAWGNPVGAKIFENLVGVYQRDMQMERLPER